MSDKTVLYTTSSEEITGAYNENLMQMQDALLSSATFDEISQKYPQLEISLKGPAKFIFTGCPLPLLNTVGGGDFPPEKGIAAIQNFLAMAKAKKCPYIWMVGNYPQPANLGKILENEGLINQTLPGLALDLTQLTQGRFDAAIKKAGITICHVQTPDQFNSWVQVEISALGLQEWQELVTTFTKAQYECLDFFLASRNDTPLATSQAFYGGGIATLFNVVTLPEARRQGIGTAITMAALMAAKQRGFKMGVLTASPMGYPVYTQMGFQEVFSFPQFVYLPDSPSRDDPSQKA